MHNALNHMWSDYRKKENAVLFKNLLYLYLLFKCVLWLLNAELLFGDYAISFIRQYPLAWWRKPAFILYYTDSFSVAILFVFSVASISIYSLVKRSTLLADVLLFLLVLNIHLKAYTTLTGAESILHNLLFISSFVRTRFLENTNKLKRLSIILHNAGIYALAFQVCLIYFYSSLAKWYNADWINGEAIHLVNQTAHYSTPFLLQHASFLFPLAWILNYIVLIYQSLFPLLGIFGKYKNKFLLLGIFMHLYIALVMGLFFFGILMIICYALFWNTGTWFTYKDSGKD